MKNEQLAELIKNGDEKAVNTLVTQNIRLVYKFAKPYQNRGIEWDDIVQEGCVGLITAAKRYDPAKGAFSTIAAWWVTQAIRRAIADQGRTIRVPEHMVHEIYRVRRAEDAAYFATATEPTIEDVAVLAGMTPAKVRKVMAYDGQVTSSLDRPTAEGLKLSEIIPGNEAPVEEQAELSELQRTLAKAKECLTPLQRRVVEARFTEERTLKEIGVELGITTSAVTVQLKKALASLRVAV